MAQRMVNWSRGRLHVAALAAVAVVVVPDARASGTLWASQLSDLGLAGTWTGSGRPFWRSGCWLGSIAGGAAVGVLEGVRASPDRSFPQSWVSAETESKRRASRWNPSATAVAFAEKAMASRCTMLFASVLSAVEAGLW